MANDAKPIDSAVSPKEGYAIVVPPTYTPEDEAYLRGLLPRLEMARVMRGRQHKEFGGTTYLDRYEKNRAAANTFLPARKNDDDVVVSYGTLEQKLLAVLSEINSLNLSPQVRAYDRNDVLVAEAGRAMDDVIAAAEELDEDEEKKLQRHLELMVQGEVFVETKWEKRYQTKKTLSGEFNGRFGAAERVKWTTRLEKCWEGATRKVLHGPNVYLGSMTTFDMQEQPFVFTVEVKTRQEAESMFGTWENWAHVPYGRSNVSNTGDSRADAQGGQMPDKKWLFEERAREDVEVIVYQDRYADEFNIVCNGVLMLPAQFPLSAVSAGGRLTIEKQVFRIVDNHWAYGKSFLSSVEKPAEVLDEMLRLTVLKTRKSFMPAYVNTSKRAISARVLSPGRITMGIPADALQALGENSEGVTPSEFQILKELQDGIDKQTVSPQFLGQQGKSGTTATESLYLQQQAKRTLGLSVFACSMLEKKLGYAMLWTLLEHWYSPVEKVVVNGQYVDRYRTASRPANVEGEGMGQREVIAVGPNQVPDARSIRALERAESATRGYPVQMTFVDGAMMRNAVKSWYIVVAPKEKEVSAMDKVLFREELADLSTLAAFGATPSVDGMEEEFARVYGRDRAKAFSRPAAAQPAVPSGVPTREGRPNVGGAPAGMSA